MQGIKGNTGSRHKFKYGPLGNTVNLASRVQGATKQLHVPILITAATRARAGGELSTRRLCRVRVVNIKEPVELFELAAPQQSGWEELRQGYETGLEALEQKDFPRAARLTGQLPRKMARRRPQPPPARPRSQALLNPAMEFNLVVDLTTK